MRDEAHADAEELIYAAAKTVNELPASCPNW